MNLAVKNVASRGAADECSGDIIEEARQHEDDDKQDTTALPVIREEGGHLVGNGAFLEVPRQQREAHQQQEQIRKDGKFVPKVQAEARKAHARFETCEAKLVSGDDRKAGKGDRQGMTVK